MRPALGIARPRLLVLGLALAGCRDVAAPVLGPDRTARCVLQQTVYTSTFPPAAVRVNSCYNRCPDDAEARAAAVGAVVLYDTACPR